MTIHVEIHEFDVEFRNVRNVIDQRCSGVAGILCCQFQRTSSRITYTERGSSSSANVFRVTPTPRRVGTKAQSAPATQ